MHHPVRFGFIALSLSLSACGTAASSGEPSRNAATEASERENSPPPPSRTLLVPSADALGVLPEGIGIEAGQPAPDAQLEDADGNPVQLSELRGDGTLLVVFYRGGWCPYCNLQIHDLVEDFSEFQERGVDVVAISVDRAEAAAHTRARYEIPFTVLSDPDLVAHRAFHVGREVPAEDIERMRGHNVDLEAASGRDHHIIAVPSVFLIDQAGVIRWSHADFDHRTRPSNEQILEAIDRLAESTESP